jgi:hypothetical protein
VMKYGLGEAHSRLELTSTNIWCSLKVDYKQSQPLMWDR